MNGIYTPLTIETPVYGALVVVITLVWATWNTMAISTTHIAHSARVSVFTRGFIDCCKCIGVYVWHAKHALIVRTGLVHDVTLVIDETKSRQKLFYTFASVRISDYFRAKVLRGPTLLAPRPNAGIWVDVSISSINIRVDYLCISILFDLWFLFISIGIRVSIRDV